MRFAPTLLALQILAYPVCAQWVFQPSGTTARLRGVCAVDARVAWASGSGGMVLLTVDGRDTWKGRIVPDANNLDFRDVAAFDHRIAYVLSIGDGESSRIYRTVDGGATWSLQHTNSDPNGFLDALAFWDADHGLALGDPVGGRFVVLTKLSGEGFHAVTMTRPATGWVVGDHGRIARFDGRSQFGRAP